MSQKILIDGSRENQSQFALISDEGLEDFEFESTLSQDNLNILDKMGHRLKPSDTIGSTQSIQIIDGINYGFADLRRPNSGVSVEMSSQ